MGDIGDSDREMGWLRWEGEVRGKRGKVGAWLEVNWLLLVADNDVVEGRRCYNFQEEYVTSLDQQLDLNVIIPVCLWLKYYKKVEQFTTVLNCVFVVNCLRNSVRAIWLHLTVHGIHGTPRLSVFMETWIFRTISKLIISFVVKVG